MGTTMNLEVQTRVLSEHTALVQLAGEMDVYTTPHAKDAMLDLLAKGYYNLVVDMQRTIYVDSTALGVLIGTLKRTREQGGDLRLVAPAPRVKRLLEITGLVNVFPIDETAEEATANLRQEENEH
jgi:anti-sigma B factor antagonist